MRLKKGTHQGHLFSPMPVAEADPPPRSPQCVSQKHVPAPNGPNVHWVLVSSLERLRFVLSAEEGSPPGAGCSLRLVVVWSGASLKKKRKQMGAADIEARNPFGQSRKSGGQPRRCPIVSGAAETGLGIYFMCDGAIRRQASRKPVA